MPAPVAPLLGFALGVLFSWAASEELARGSGTLLGQRSLAIVVLFSFLVFGPAAGYFLTFSTDWSFAYYVDGRRIPSAVELLAVLFDIVTVPAGFAVGATQARQRRLVPLLPLGTVPMALAVIFIGLFSRRLGLHGSHGQVARGLGATPLAGSPTGQAVLWLNLCLLAGVSWTLRELRQLSAEYRRD
jgi:hypothetical protein